MTNSLSLVHKDIKGGVHPFARQNIIHVKIIKEDNFVYIKVYPINTVKWWKIYKFHVEGLFKIYKFCHSKAMLNIYARDSVRRWVDRSLNNTWNHEKLTVEYKKIKKTTKCMTSV